MAGSADTLPPRPEPKFRTIVDADGKEIKIAVGPYFVGDYDNFRVLPAFSPYDAYGHSTGPSVNDLCPLDKWITYIR